MMQDVIQCVTCLYCCHHHVDAERETADLGTVCSKSNRLPA